jgi:hypothetical protein
MYPSRRTLASSTSTVLVVDAEKEGARADRRERVASGFKDTGPHCQDTCYVDRLKLLKPNLNLSTRNDALLLLSDIITIITPNFYTPH